MRGEVSVVEQATGNGQERSGVSPDSLRVAVLVPCHNEEATIECVVEDFRKQLPRAVVYVYDNASSDRTAERARAAGAVVRTEARKGKGYVVQRMFADIEADVYVLVDGDATYDPESVQGMVRVVCEESVDMVVGARVPLHTDRDAHRPGHRFGNALLTGVVSRLFGADLRDMLSGYRVFSRRFVKCFPAFSGGFEVETELTVFALELRLPFTEIDTRYLARPEDSESKLRTFSDGWRILLTILILLKEVRPFTVFSVMALVLAGSSLGLGVPIVRTFLDTGLVPRFPTPSLRLR
jgi:glycosyltransferase involved in cell wall biosynthesis